ncbi:hypothetical protein [Hyphomonas sp.]|uniref:hypothetical protein n=1 Tax=Hyphomonas sp. TaxID=87 RepID=UPI003919A95E
MRAVLLASSLVFASALSGCVAAAIVTAPIRLAGNVLEAGGKGLIYVGGQAVRVTGDLLDGPDQEVRLTITYQRGRNSTRSESKIIKAKDLEREVQRMSRRGKVIDVVVEPVA